MKARFPSFGSKQEASGRSRAAKGKRDRKVSADRADAQSSGLQNWLPRLPTRQRDGGGGPAAVVLRPYHRGLGRTTALLLLALVAVLCFLEGYGFSVFAPFRMVPFF